MKWTDVGALNGLRRICRSYREARRSRDGFSHVDFDELSLCINVIQVVVGVVVVGVELVVVVLPTETCRQLTRTQTYLERTHRHTTDWHRWKWSWGNHATIGHTSMATSNSEDVFRNLIIKSKWGKFGIKFQGSNFSCSYEIARLLPCSLKHLNRLKIDLRKALQGEFALVIFWLREAY